MDLSKIYKINVEVEQFTMDDLGLATCKRILDHTKFIPEAARDTFLDIMIIYGEAVEAAMITGKFNLDVYKKMLQLRIVSYVNKKQVKKT